MLKFGTGNLGGNDTYFFKNLGRLSHYTLFEGFVGGGGASGEVPEPTTVALFGLGLLGFWASRRKARKA
ncbi:PEP-CTERM sorting domain-containing protein [Noviherbaspirillum sp. L7-7A]|uniref:PEP-CTERM sorting domain-containing protein n=1 Tax=Noviherbaspirillum sp. L7-7A TaxID=2850560 RepID=UPI0032C4AF58